MTPKELIQAKASKIVMMSTMIRDGSPTPDELTMVCNLIKDCAVAIHVAAALSE